MKTAQERLAEMMQDLNLSVSDLATICNKSESTMYNVVSGRSEFPGYLYLALDTHEKAKHYLTGVMEAAKLNKDVKKLREAENYRKFICGV